MCSLYETFVLINNLEKEVNCTFFVTGTSINLLTKKANVIIIISKVVPKTVFKAVT